MNGTERISYEKQFGIYPSAEYCPQFDPDGYPRIKAFTFAGVPLNGTVTKVFAFIGVPEHCRFPAPAVILVHGGGCHPDCEWMNKWIDRGYIALAMDTTGYFPAKEHTAFSEGNRVEWVRKIPRGIVSEEFTVSPDNSGMNDINIPTENRWMYHAVSQVILCHNILRSYDYIDNNKIGICGISWGGVISSIAIGFDRRFAFAIPIYGSAFLSEGLSEIDKPFKTQENAGWLAEKYYGDIQIPILWQCWNDDACFSINSVSKSYQLTSKYCKNTRISIKHLMNHSHICVYSCEERYWFAGLVIKGEKIPKIDEKILNRKVFFKFTEEKIKVRLFYITEELTYTNRIKYGIENYFMKQEWLITEWGTNPKYGILPDNAIEYYFEYTLKNGIVLTSRFYELNC